MVRQSASHGSADDPVPEIRAPITGSVHRVLVAEGDSVDAEHVVVVLESMKLEIVVEAERVGTVRRVLVAPGDAVSEGDPLLELEPATAVPADVQELEGA